MHSICHSIYKNKSGMAGMSAGGLGRAIVFFCVRGISSVYPKVKIFSVWKPKSPAPGRDRQYDDDDC